MKEISIENIQALAEDVELEVKRATGRDGKGELPASFFETYSAMANTSGGVILLGIEEKPKGTFRAVGIPNVEKVLKALWDGLNNPQRVSSNLLSDKMVMPVKVDGKPGIEVTVPPAPRSKKPVYIGENPLTGTFQRRFEGDYKCDRETVRRMLADQAEEARDARVMRGYDLKDLDSETIKAYRGMMRVTKPDHPWNSLDTKEFLTRIGGWGRNRDTGDEGLTLAGIFMFGKLPSILDAAPNYIVDYQEQLESRGKTRWIDRLTTDGTWSGNLFDFYRMTIQKLTTGLKVPFRLKGTQRRDDTPVHEALREALVNALIHADFSGRVSILVVKRPNMFGFRNPGTMRIPVETAISGGESDCRNRRLQKMFQLVGLGEQAGSGIPKIYRNWKRQHWKPPDLRQRIDPEQTVLRLAMVDLFPDWVNEELVRRFGDQFRALPEVERSALALTVAEGQVTHSRLKDVTEAHPHDLSKSLHELVKDGFLIIGGARRGAYYFFPDMPPPSQPELFEDQVESAPPKAEFQKAKKPGSQSTDTVHLETDSVHLPPSTVHLGSSPVHLPLDSVQLEMLKNMVSDISEKGKVTRETMITALLKICKDKFLSLREMAEILNRKSETLRIHYVNQLVADSKLVLLYPDKARHPNQRYKTSEVMCAASGTPPPAQEK